MGAPSVYLFYGDHPLEISETLTELEAKLGPSGEFNVRRFSGAALDLDELQAACNALPFLSDRRLIIIEEAQALPNHHGYRERLEDVLMALPKTTALVFVEHLDLDERNSESRYKSSSFLYAWAEAHSDVAYTRRFERPKGPAFVRWLQDRAEGQIEGEAAQLLAHYVDNNPLLGEQELRKLLDHSGGERPVTADDVERLTPYYGQADVFAVVDELGTRAGGLSKLQQLLEEQDPGYVFLMIVRQFRLLIQARSAMDSGADPVAAMPVPAFVARKVAAQARGFTLAQLESTYHRLLELDVSVKRGQADLALDLLPLVASFQLRTQPA